LVIAVSPIAKCNFVVAFLPPVPVEAIGPELFKGNMGFTSRKIVGYANVTPAGSVAVAVSVTRLVLRL
jgi:hypothetical protein